MNSIVFDSDDNIYNRFDLIRKHDYVEREYISGAEKYLIAAYAENGVAHLNVWGKTFPQSVFENVIADVFNNKKIYAIEITRAGNQYKDFLEQTNDIRVPLPETAEELMNRVERRDRATIRRKLRWLDERVGEVKINVYSVNEIPDELVELYFNWKKETHGTDYGLSSKEYLEKYYVTDGMVMYAGETPVAVAFFCQVNKTVFFENFSYNSKLKDYSPGLLMYVKFMEELITRKCSYLYLGGGAYIYKKRFGSESFTAYSGIIYRKEIINAINEYLDNNEYKNIAFYGYGVCGHSFKQLSNNLNINISYGLDKNSDENENIISPNSELEDVDGLLITLNNRNVEVEEYAKKNFKKYVYWNDVLEQIISNYKLEG